MDHDYNHLQRDHFQEDIENHDGQPGVRVEERVMGHRTILMSGESRRGAVKREGSEDDAVGRGTAQALRIRGSLAVTAQVRMAPIISDLPFPPCLPPAQQDSELGGQWLERKMKEH